MSAYRGLERRPASSASSALRSASSSPVSLAGHCKYLLWVVQLKGGGVTSPAPGPPGRLAFQPML